MGDDRKHAVSSHERIMPRQPRAPVSAVIPCYRCKDTIDAAVASIAAQTLPPAEVILVDDCGRDGTLETLHELASVYPPGWVKVVSQPTNGGPSCARNAGWRTATQEYVAFLDADDSWAPAKLELQIEYEVVGEATEDDGNPIRSPVSVLCGLFVSLWPLCSLWQNP